MGEPRNHFETWSFGIDEGLQGVSGDPWGTIAATGLRVPTLATPDASHRYLFLLAGFELGERDRATIRGWRELLTLGVSVAGTIVSDNPTNITSIVELPVTNPIFRLPDGNVSWHLSKIDPTVLNSYVVGPPPIAPPISNFSWRLAKGPALLYEVGTAVTGSGFYTDLTAYKPPNLGRPYGEPLAHLKVSHDVRTEWLTRGVWNSLDLDVEGPGYFAMWASVAQSSGLLDFSARSTALGKVQGGLSEWQFMAAFPAVLHTASSPLWWRVGGALDVLIHDRAGDTSECDVRSGRGGERKGSTLGPRGRR